MARLPCVVLLPEVGDDALVIHVHRAIASGIGDMGAEERGVRAGTFIVRHKFLQGRIDKAVAVHDHHRLTLQRAANIAYRAGGAQRLGFSDRFDRKPVDPAIGGERFDLVGFIPDAEDHPPHAEAGHPIKLKLQEWPVIDGRQHLGPVRHNAGQPGAEAPRQDHDINVGKLGHSAP